MHHAASPAEQGSASVESVLEAINVLMEKQVLDGVGKCIVGGSALNKRGTEQKEKQQSAFALIPEKAKANATSNLLRRVEKELRACTGLVEAEFYTAAFKLKRYCHETALSDPRTFGLSSPYLSDPYLSDSHLYDPVDCTLTPL